MGASIFYGDDTDRVSYQEYLSLYLTNMSRPKACLMPVQAEKEASGQEQILVVKAWAPAWGQTDDQQVRNEMMVATPVWYANLTAPTSTSHYFQTPGERGRENICGDGDGPELWPG